VWSIDGNQRGTATGAGKNWTFTWQLPADGAYDVSAQSFAGSGLTGDSRSVTLVVNRFAPTAPTRANAGRNGSVVEVEWAANRERDIVGYRVYRQPSGGQATLACPMSTKTSCVDATPPAGGGSALEYWVVAVDRDPSGADREGAPSTRIDVNAQNKAPFPPDALTLSTDAQGNTVLRWQRPAIADPDSGDYIASYRIYRDGTAIANRYDRVAGTESMATDASSGGVPHQYWVTSVDSHLAESTPLGPVTG
jgi:fibronectin type 3 domain-containing protein